MGPAFEVDVGRDRDRALFVGGGDEPEQVVGGDAVKGTRFADLIPHFAADPATRALVVIGEIGGSEEEEFAAALIAQRFAKPVYALIAGKAAREGVTMGHAGALVFGGVGTIESKVDALTRAGARVFTRIQVLVDAVAAAPAL